MQIIKDNYLAGGINQPVSKRSSDVPARIIKPAESLSVFGG